MPEPEIERTLRLLTRLWFAWACFLRVLLDGAFAARAWEARFALGGPRPPQPPQEPPALPPPAAPAEAVQAAPSPDGGRNHMFAVVGIRHVTDHSDRVSPLPSQFRFECRQPVGGPGREGEFRPFLGELPRERVPDSARSPGQNEPLPSQHPPHW